MSRKVVPLPLLLVVAASLFAQDAPSSATTSPLKNPASVGDYSVKARPRFWRTNRLPASTRTALQTQGVLGAAAVKITSVQRWSSSFTTAGKTYHYTMVGSAPGSNKTTYISTALLPIRFVFDGYKDASGNKLVISPSGVLTKVKNSPNWVTSSYATGHTQFADAVQRAEFHKTMGANWHTLLRAPRMLPTAAIEIPAGQGFVYKTTSGAVFARVDADAYQAGITKILSSVDLLPGEFPLAISRNILIFSGRPSNCCILGFHTSFQSGGTSTNPTVQTFGWASYLDKRIFAITDIADVWAVSHEISEWMNDPFVDNATPPWQFPNGSGCQANLETGDPVEVLDNSSIPVTINGFAYHPQTEALLQWFSREKPSSAIYGAYSFPDISALRTPSKPCQ